MTDYSKYPVPADSCASNIGPEPPPWLLWNNRFHFPFAQLTAASLGAALGALLCTALIT